MNRIDKKMKEAKVLGKKILSPYITAGDPEPALTLPLMRELVRQGADILEIGIPFSDPMAEGPVIQQAMERALAHHVSTHDVLAMIREFRKEDNETAIVLMGYLNPVEQYGYAAFARDAASAGVDGTILVDLPPEESDILLSYWQENQLYPIFLCSPTTSAARMALMNDYAKGYLYYVSLKGVTGAEGPELSELQAAYEERKAQTDLPLMVGFGIKTADMARAVAQFADGVIVGAALISSLNAAYEENPEQILTQVKLIEDMRHAIDSIGS